FALVWAVLVLSGAYPFMLGSALALVALSALQRRRRAAFAAGALGTLAASPLAFLLLVVVLAGVALARRRDAASLVAPAAAVAAIGTAEVVLQRMFPAHGTFPFSTAEFAAAATFCLIGIVMSWRVSRARLLRWLFVVYLVACSAAFAVPSQVGENIARLRFFAVPLAVLTLSLRDWRPRFVCAGALALAVSWNLTPLAASFSRGFNDPAATASYWQPANGQRDRLRDSLPQAADPPARTGAAARLRVDAPGRPAPGDVHPRADLCAVLAHPVRLRAGAAERDDEAHGAPAGHHPAALRGD